MTLRAFLVEDNTDLRDTVVEAMETLAPVHFVGAATNELSARQWLAANGDNWDIAIIDLMLSQGSGFGVLEACRQRDPAQKIVVLTGHVEEHFVQRCRDLGADEVFDKTSDIERMVDFCRIHEMYIAFMQDSGLRSQSDFDFGFDAQPAPPGFEPTVPTATRAPLAWL